MLRNATKAADLPLQLKRAKEVLSTLQAQLASAKKATLKPVVKSGTASIQPEIEDMKRLKEEYNRARREVEYLTREINASKAAAGQGYCFIGF